MPYNVRLSTRGRITIPKKLRDKLGLHGGVKLEWREVDGRVEARIVEPAR